jgi:hypothetical protein
LPIHPFVHVTVTLTDIRDGGLDEMLTSELRWIMKVAEHAELTILGKQVVLPNLNVVAAVRLE